MLIYKALMKYCRKNVWVYKYLMMIPNCRLTNWSQPTTNYNNNYWMLIKIKLDTLEIKRIKLIVNIRLFNNYRSK